MPQSSSSRASTVGLINSLIFAVTLFNQNTAVVEPALQTKCLDTKNGPKAHSESFTSTPFKTWSKAILQLSNLLNLKERLDFIKSVKSVKKTRKI